MNKKHKQRTGTSGPGPALFSALTFWMALTFSSSQAGEVTAHIMLNPKAVVARDSFVLGEIAQIEVLEPQLADQLGAVEIGQSPAAGQIRNIDPEQIRLRLRQSGIDPSPMRIDGAVAIEVSRHVQVISGSQIEQIVRDYLNARINDPAAKVSLAQPCADVVLPQGKVTTKVETPRQTNLVGKVHLSVVFEIDGQQAKKAWVAADVAILAEVVVARRALARLEVITEQDIELRSVNLLDQPPGVISDSAEVVGQRAKKTILADTPLRSDMVELVPLVKKGDVVQMVTQKAGLRVTALGEVRQSGAMGERIQVMNVDSRKILFAKVVDSRTVAIGR